MKPLVRSLVAASLGLCACGNKPPTTPGDASTGSDGSNVSDGSVDALVGTLTPDPPDPSGTACAGILGFPNPPSLQVRPIDMLVADVDVDGAKDIVYMTFSVIGIARGAGDGTFLAPTTMTVPSNSRNLRVGDVNGDGKPDLFYSASGGIRQMLALPAGGFAAAEIVSSPSNPTQLELADITGDGRLDIVALGGSQLTTVINSATGFGAGQSYSTGASGSVFAMSVGDLTGDGRPDVAIADNTGSSIRVLVNTGSGAYGGIPSAYPAASGPWGIVLADVNEDGMRDVVAGTSATSGARVSVLLNQGNGVFGAPTNFSVPNSTPRSLAAADVDGDGHIDIGAVDEVSSSTKLLLGTGTGQLSAPVEFAYVSPVRIAFADLNGNGTVDMVLSNYEYVSPFVNTGAATLFESRKSFTFDNPGSAEKGVRMTDIDSDGHLDLLRLGDASADGIVSTRLSSAGGTFGPSTTYPTLAAYATALGDMNDDARADLVIAGYGTGQFGLQTLVNGGNGTLAPVPRFGLSLAGSPNGLAIADMDGNGIRDVVIRDYVPGSPSQNTVKFFPGLGNGQFAGSGTLVWSGPSATGFVVGDFDGNGKPDVAVETFEGVRRLYVVLATGGGAFATPMMIEDQAIPDHQFSRDINGDGHADLIGFTQIPAVGVSVMLGDGAGAFGTPQFSPTNRLGSEMAFGDVNGDGHLDVAIPGVTVAVLPGNGNGTFAAAQYFESGGAGQTGSDVNLGDIDGDGHLDIVVTNDYDRVNVMFGRCHAP